MKGELNDSNNSRYNLVGYFKLDVHNLPMYARILFESYMGRFFVLFNQKQVLKAAVLKKKMHKKN